MFSTKRLGLNNYKIMKDKDIKNSGKVKYSE